MKRICLAILFFLLSITLCATAKPLVTCAQGTIAGFSKQGVEVFLGIPYAEAPIGDLRFAPPLKKSPFKEEFHADSFCPVAPQNTVLIKEYGGESYDRSCLCLNIFRPEIPPESKNGYPVLVWIHGGAYVQGTGSLPLYDGSAFARKGVIVVTLNYRLGAEGFLSSLYQQREFGTTGNWGHLDILEALKWVQENIVDFGGDPHNVTLAGHSAGAFAASAMILNKEARGLFQKAILQSGTLLSYPFIGFDAKTNNIRALANTQRLMSMFEVEDSKSGLDILRSIDATLLSYQCGFDYDFVHNKTSYIPPFLDGVVLPKSPYDSLLTGDFNDVAVLLGYNTDEGTLFSSPEIKDDDFYYGLHTNFPRSIAENLEKIYAIDKKHSAYERFCEYNMDMMFTLGMKIFADKLSRRNKVYLYHFDFISPNSYGKKYGVAHSGELRYVFMNLKPDSKKTEKDVAEVVNMRWVNFIKTGDPNFDGRSATMITWPNYTEKQRVALKLGTFTIIEPFALEERLNRLENIIFKRSNEDAPVEKNQNVE